VKDLPKVPTWWLEWERKEPNLQLSHHAPQYICDRLWQKQAEVTNDKTAEISMCMNKLCMHFSQNCTSKEYDIIQFISHIIGTVTLAFGTTKNGAMLSAVRTERFRPPPVVQLGCGLWSQFF